MTRDALLRSMAGTVWAMDRARFAEMLASADLSAAMARVRTASEPSRQGRSTGIVHILGPIEHRPSLLSELFGGTSAMQIGAQIREFAADPSIGRIILDIDSPGGTTFGLTELAATIREARKTKSITALANPTAASAAYWIASQAHEVVVTPSGWVGSIGVFVTHVDESRRLDAAGITPTLIVSDGSPYKAEDDSTIPLSKSARAELQSLVDKFYAMFLTDVALGRRVPAARVRSDYGKGRMLLASDAVRAGVADRIGTLESVVAGPIPAGPARSQLDLYRRRATAHVR